MRSGLARVLLGMALVVSGHGAEAPVQETQLRLGLFDALRLRFAQGRDRQDAVDDLSLARSVFANVRNDYGPQWRGSLRAGANGRFDTDDSERMQQEIALGVDQTLPGGGRIDVNAGIERDQDLDGDDVSYANGLDIALRQPLLRDAGLLPWRERLTQAERDLIYARRSHERFIQELALGTAFQFWRLQEQFFALERLKEAVARARFALEQAQAFVEIGRSSAGDVLRAEVQVLQAEQTYTDAVAALERGLDTFRVDLGLPPSVDMDLVGGLPHMPRLRIDTSAAIDLALSERLDWLTRQDRHEDRRRALLLANRNLLPRLDLSASLGFSDSGDEAARFDDERRWSAGLELELPLNRDDEILAHQRALIALAKSRRDLDEFRQQIINEVTDAVRGLRTATSTVLIQRRQVEQSALRLEKSQMDFEAGLISNRDLLEAQADLRQAQISLFRARVDRLEAELELRQATGQLQIEPSGRWSDELPSYASIDEGNP